jgi:hypothetical protein
MMRTQPLSLLVFSTTILLLFDSVALASFLPPPSNPAPLSTTTTTTAAIGTPHQDGAVTLEHENSQFWTIAVPRFDTNDSGSDGEDNDGDAGHCGSASRRRGQQLLHRIHVRSVLTDAQVQRVRELAGEHSARTGCWEGRDTTRHATYGTCDFAVQDCASLTRYLDEIRFHDRVLDDLLCDLYDVDRSDLEYLDLFCAQYKARPNSGNITSTTTMDRLEGHRDGSSLSFTVTLSDPDEFQGGGTVFDALRDVEPDAAGGGDSARPVLQPGGVVRPVRAGDAVLHSGKLLHGAHVVTHGTRVVLVGFVDVSSHRLRPGAMHKACRDWGRMDVAKFRWERQAKQTAKKATTKKNGWRLNHGRWLPCMGSLVRGICPAFESVGRRADSEYIRLKKLEAEDRLLRSLLLSREEAVMENDYTILQSLDD